MKHTTEPWETKSPRDDEAHSPQDVVESARFILGKDPWGSVFFRRREIEAFHKNAQHCAQTARKWSAPHSGGRALFLGQLIAPLRQMFSTNQKRGAEMDTTVYHRLPDGG